MNQSPMRSQVLRRRTSRAEQSIALHCSSIVDHAAGHEEHAKDVNFFWVEVH
jgi:hypothetical protein